MELGRLENAKSLFQTYLDLAPPVGQVCAVQS